MGHIWCTCNTKSELLVMGEGAEQPLRCLSQVLCKALYIVKHRHFQENPLQS